MERYKYLLGLGGLTFGSIAIFSFLQPLWWVVWFGVAIYNSYDPVD